jgi:hypothetical protein
MLCAAAASGVATDGIAGPPQHRPTSSKASSAPTAVGFATIFVGTANGYAKQHGHAARFGNADCVEAARGRYMCSYTITEPGSHADCHLMQARWTPTLASTYTITLAGRVRRCATLRQALRSLG